MSKSIRMGTQAHKILEHLKSEGSITGAEAYLIYKARSCTKRISELRKAGYSIKSEWRKDVTGQRYVRYWLDRKAPRRLMRIESIHPCDAYFKKRASLVGEVVEVLEYTKHESTDYGSAKIKFPKGKTIHCIAIHLETL